MRSTAPVALLCGDIHLSAKPPVFRSGEPDWFAAMARGLRQMGDHAECLQIPIICAGDIFDKAHGPVEVVNFALDHLPEMYAVPGQHDLPYHRLEAMGESAFGVLVKAGRVRCLDYLGPVDRGLEPYRKTVKGLRLFGFPWNCDLYPCPDGPPAKLRIAVIHRYVWLRDEHKHPTASPDSSWLKLKAQLQGYDLCVFGDNHRGFYSKKEKVFNCGTFFRRKSDEMGYEPRYGVLKSDGTVESVPLDTSADVYGEQSEERVESRDVDYIKALEALSGDPLNFEEHLTRALDGEPDEVRSAVLSAGGSDGK